MGSDIQSLESTIRSILTAPGVDLTTISAKRVRKQLTERDPTLTADHIREHKDDIDALISQVFEEVSGAQEGSGDEEDEPAHSSKRKMEDEDDDGGDDKDAALPKKKKSKKGGQEKSDEKLARKLSSEINGQPHRAGKGRSNGPTKKKGRSKKSMSTVDSGGEEDQDAGGKKKKGGGGGKGGFAKEYLLSEPLSALLQVEKLSRPQVVKQLWNYIKENGLQNPLNKREIICDTGFRAVFSVDKVDMFKMNKILGQHLHEPSS